MRRVIAYDVCTNGLESALLPFPPATRQKLVDWLDAGADSAVNNFFAEAMAKSLLLDWMIQHQLPNQIAALAHVRSLTARLFTRAEQAQNHVQVGNFGLAFRVMIDWMESLGTIDTPCP